jgi:putative flippase GtrA
VRFGAVGVVSTLAYALLYLLLRAGLPAGAANAVALAFTAVANTAANRRFTFGVRGREQAVRHHVLGALVFIITLGLTSGALVLLHALSPRPGRLLEAAVLVVASACATVTRFVGLSSLVFPGYAAASARSAARVTGQSPP